MKDIFLVTGATGHVGKEAALALLGDNSEVRGITRDKNRATLLPAGVKPIIGSLSDPESLAGALQDVVSIFMLSGVGDEAKFLELAKQKGVPHVVVLSGGVATTGDRNNSVTAAFLDTEDIVKASGLEWTILRPGAFMTNVLGWSGQLKHGDVVRAPFPHLEQALLDPADIGHVVAAIMKDHQRHSGKIYELTGRERLSNADRVRIMAEVLGRSLIYEPLTPEQARTAMSKMMPKHS